MSTDHQQYSPENQKAAIAAYACEHDIDIVETYEDDGRSGVTLRHRPALLKLLKDVLDPGRAFQTVLVYDISRWGRFQDVDESAHHEYICRQAGVSVIYCAEPFTNDGTPASNIIKTVKRAMAGEYSRELSEKVFLGQSRHVERGFWLGASPGYGLRRMLVDANGTLKSYLKQAEHKAIRADHTILVPGPPNETALVKTIFSWYVHDNLGTGRIADRLNGFGLYNSYGNPWRSNTIRLLLRNEKYVGNLVWNRTSIKLHTPLIRNDPSKWYRNIGAFSAIVDRDLFEAAQRRINRFRIKPNIEAIAASMSRLLRSNGKLSVRAIRSELDIPGKSTVRRRMTSLQEGYRLAGYNPPCDIAYVDQRVIAKRSMATHIDDLIGRLRAQGHSVEYNATRSLLLIDGDLRIKVTTSLGQKDNTFRPYAQVTKSTVMTTDLCLVGYYPRPSIHLVGFYLLPGSVIANGGMTTLCDSQVPGVEGFRMSDLSAVLTLCARAPLGGLP
ncbi:recombinase family protein [Paraburkholderia sp. 22B1P]|uniref:recombinase family protein n=1 Tax=Paraburkholderia sp. 22B1P TaxID=3080498 RepID=UPI0030D2E688